MQCASFSAAGLTATAASNRYKQWSAICGHVDHVATWCTSDPPAETGASVSAITVQGEIVTNSDWAVPVEMGGSSGDLRISIDAENNPVVAVPNGAIKLPIGKIAVPISVAGRVRKLIVYRKARKAYAEVATNVAGKEFSAFWIYETSDDRAKDVWYSTNGSPWRYARMLRLDRTSSGCWAQVWKDHDFISDSYRFDGPQMWPSLSHLPAATKDWGDEIESLTVGPAASVTLWEDEGYTDTAQSFGPGQYHNVGKLDDTADSLKVTCR